MITQGRGFTPQIENILYCARCGKELHPPYEYIKKIGKKCYCDSCYGILKNTNPKWGTEMERMKLYELIKSTFKVSELPDLWVEQINKLLLEDNRRNYTNLYYTIVYAIKIEEYVPDPLYGVSGLVHLFFDKAAKYYNNLQKVLANNEKVEIVNEKKVVRIPRPKVEDPKPKTRIEDL